MSNSTSPDDELVTRVAMAIEPWDKKLADYLGENPVIERASAAECEKEARAKRKARAAIPVVLSAYIRWLDDDEDYGAAASIEQFLNAIPLNPKER